MLKIYGASDDLIEVESDNQREFHSEEFQADQTNVLGFSDGTLLEIRYDKWGVWRITSVVRGLNFIRIEPAETDIKSDYAFIDAHNIEWIILSKEEIRP